MKIGILGRYSHEKSLMVSGPYVAFFKQFLDRKTGNDSLVIIDPLQTGVVDLNLLVLPGGEDVDPSRYNQDTLAETNNPNIHYEFFDKNTLPKYIEQNIPIFGICRGFQTINVATGGSLTQDLPDHPTSMQRNEAAHKIVFNQVDILPFKIKQKMEVNSLHHQGILDNDLSPSMIPLAKSVYDNRTYNIEAISHKDKPIVGVQWHPEEIQDIFSIKTIQFLLKGAK